LAQVVYNRRELKPGEIEERVVEQPEAAQANRAPDGR